MELYNKYRPQTIDEILGNDTLLQSMKTSIENGNKVFLLSGNGGTGKTTIARVFAKTIIEADPSAIVEINSAENRGIDSARDIMDAIKFKPLGSNALVYILDEFHQQTSASQNAFLKVLEDCPEYCYFFICTTEAEKIIEPLKTRCNICNVKPLSSEILVRLLNRICKKEGKTINIDILSKIADNADGSARRAIKTLSSIMFLENEEQMLEMIENDNANSPEVIEFVRSVFRGDGIETNFQLLDKIQVENTEAIRRIAMSYAESILKKKLNKNAVAMLQVFSNVDTFKNAKHALYVAVLDFYDFINN